MNWQRNGYEFSDDKSRLDLDVICGLLSDTYWAADRPRSVVEKTVQHSVCFGLYHDGKQVGFARAITDFATFAYIGDVIIDAEHRGRGLGKWMMECLLTHPAVATQTQCLRTRDAHWLYEPLGFERTEYLRRSGSDWSKQKPARS